MRRHRVASNLAICTSTGREGLSAGLALSAEQATALVHWSRASRANWGRSGSTQQLPFPPPSIFRRSIFSHFSYSPRRQPIFCPCGSADRHASRARSAGHVPPGFSSWTGDGRSMFDVRAIWAAPPKRIGRAVLGRGALPSVPILDWRRCLALGRCGRSPIPHVMRLETFPILHVLSICCQFTVGAVDDCEQFVPAWGVFWRRSGGGY